MTKKALSVGEEALSVDFDLATALLPKNAHLADQQQQGINQKVQRYFERLFHKLNPNTRKAYTADLKQYFAFCQQQQPMVDPLCADFDRQAEQLEQYIDHLCTSNKKRFTIIRHLKAISKLLRIAGIRNPLRESEETRDYLKLTLNQLDNHGELIKPAAQNQALPLDDKLLDHINATFEIANLQDKRDIALLNFCFNTLLRGSEISQIQVSDLNRDSQQCYVAKTKTDKTGKGCYRHVSTETFALIDRWLSAAAITTGPVFQSLSPKGTSLKQPSATKGISYRSVYRIYKQVLTRCGLDNQGYSAHSCRVGAVVTMRRHHLSMGEMLLAGGWQSETMIVRYGAKTEAEHSGAATLSRLRRTATLTDPANLDQSTKDDPR